MPTFSNSYLVTNRQASGGTWGSQPQASGALSFLTAPTPGGRISYQSDASQYTLVAGGNTPNGSLPSAFADALVADLQTTVNSAQQAQLTVFVHGLDTDWAGAASDLGRLGMALQNMGPKGGHLLSFDTRSACCKPVDLKAQYAGLVLGFSWPCAPIGLRFITDFYDTRVNAAASTASLVQLVQALQGLAAQFSGGLRLSIVAHSEGCWLTGQTAAPLLNAAAAPLDQLLLLAADLDTTSLGPITTAVAADNPPLMQIASQVTAYWSSHDDRLDLIGNQAAFDLMQRWPLALRDSTVARLGLSGASAAQTLSTNSVALDCSEVVVAAQVCSAEKTHLAYLYMPPVLQDMACVLMGLPPIARAGTGTRQTLDEELLVGTA